MQNSEDIKKMILRAQCQPLLLDESLVPVVCDGYAREDTDLK